MSRLLCPTLKTQATGWRKRCARCSPITGATFYQRNHSTGSIARFLLLTSMLFSFQAGAAAPCCLATALAGMNNAVVPRWLSADGGLQVEGGTVTPSTLKSRIDFMEENDVCPPLLRETTTIDA